jgi:hypothetical protein
MNLHNLGRISHLDPNTNVPNTESTVLLASTLSDAFDAFSVKTYCGQIKTTDLSKCFAAQSVKIAGKGHGGGEDQGS